MPARFQFVLAWILIPMSILGCDRNHGTSAERQATTENSVYVVSQYDPKRDAKADLAEAIMLANSSQRRILLQVGGDWCPWCHRMSEFFESHEAVRKAIQDRFVVLKINFSEEQPNEEFLSQFPAIDGYPHLFVLDTQGKLVHSQSTEVLEEGDSYDERKVVEFLQHWSTAEPEGSADISGDDQATNGTGASDDALNGSQEES